MIRLLLSALFLVVSTLGFSQDSLFSKMYYASDHAYIINGKVVHQSKVSNNNTSVSVEKLAAGTYMYRFTSSKNAVSRGKLIIEK